jgi:hypothetical protein
MTLFEIRERAFEQMFGHDDESTDWHVSGVRADP